MSSEINSFNSYLNIWPESESLISALNDKQNFHIYIKPEIKFTEVLFDKSVKTYLDLEEKPIEPSIVNDHFGLKLLLKYGNLKGAFNLTTNLLKNLGYDVPGAQLKNTVESFEIWSIRFQLLLVLKMHSHLLNELLPFKELNSPDTYFQYYPEYNSQTGSIIPYSLRLVHAEALLYSTEPWNAFNRVKQLENNTKKAISIAENLNLTEQQLNVWYKRLESLQLIKRYDKVFNIYKMLLNSLDENNEEERLEWLKTIIRMAFTVGNSKLLNDYIELFLQLNKDKNLEALYKSYKAIFYGTYDSAYELINKVPHIENNLKYLNNKAICMLYNEKVEEALNSLQNHSGPTIEPIAINILTISDLTSTSNLENIKKYFSKHFDNVNNMLDPALIKIDF